MKKIFVFSFLSAAILSGCSGGGSGSTTAANPSVNADGTCTSQFRDEYNGIVNARKALVRDSSEDNVRAVKNKCDSFRAHHAQSVTCVASNIETGESLSPKASDMYTYCADVDGVLSGKADVLPIIQPQAGNNCPETFRVDYNGVNGAFNSVLAHPQTSDFSDVKNKCDAFRKRNAESDTCDADITRNGTTTRIHLKGTDTYTACGKIDDYYKKKANLEAP